MIQLTHAAQHVNRTAPVARCSAIGGAEPWRLTGKAMWSRGPSWPIFTHMGFLLPSCVWINIWSTHTHIYIYTPDIHYILINIFMCFLFTVPPFAYILRLCHRNGETVLDTLCFQKGTMSLLHKQAQVYLDKWPTIR